MIALQAEYDQLTKVKRKEISAVVQRARELSPLHAGARHGEVPLHGRREHRHALRAALRLPQCL